jgi:hypothetical protein
MHKYLVVFFIFFNAFVSFSQTETVVSTKTLRVSNAAVAFNQNIPIGTLIFNIAENRLFIAKTGVESTNTLTTANGKFELLNDGVNESHNPISKTADYTTALTKGGTLLVRPASGATVTITLTTTNVAVGKRYSVKKANTTDGTVLVQSESGVTIEGTSSIETNVPYQGWILQFDGINWHIIGHI